MYCSTTYISCISYVDWCNMIRGNSYVASKLLTGTDLISRKWTFSISRVLEQTKARCPSCQTTKMTVIAGKFAMLRSPLFHRCFHKHIYLCRQLCCCSNKADTQLVAECPLTRADRLCHIKKMTKRQTTIHQMAKANQDNSSNNKMVTNWGVSKLQWKYQWLSKTHSTSVHQ